MGTSNITILLPEGRLPLEVLDKVRDLAREHGLTLYLTNEQNLRLLQVPQEKTEGIKQELVSLGVDLKGPGKLPLPRVCVGRDNCDLGRMDPARLSRRIVERLSQGAEVKPKLKMGISACTMACSGATIKDMGVVASKNGYSLYVGGKGGVSPQPGRRVLKEAGEEDILQAMQEIFCFHQERTPKKQRMAKLIDEPDFPYPPLD